MSAGSLHPSHIGLFAATRWEEHAARVALDRLAPCPPRSIDGSEESLVRAKRTGRRRRMVARRDGCRLTLVRSGMGSLNATQAASDLLDEGPCHLLLSVGFACGLTPTAAVGDLLVGTDSVQLDGMPGGAPSSPVPCDAASQRLAIQAARTVGVPVTTGRIATAGRIVVRAVEKHRIATHTGAVGLDMESAALGAVAARHRTPFAILRTVSDLRDEDLPDFNLFLTAWGMPRGLVSLLRPSSMLALARLRRQTAVASERLTTVLARFLQDAIVCRFGQA